MSVRIGRLVARRIENNFEGALKRAARVYMSTPTAENHRRFVEELHRQHLRDEESGT